MKQDNKNQEIFQLNFSKAKQSK